jgi:UDP-glucose:(heptosyl)LPS alpha-1,3-glucosyltransferase
LRIALSNTDVDLSGGVERVVAECANLLASRGHDVTVVAARVDPKVLDPAVKVRLVPVPLALDARTGLGFRSRAGRALREIDPDVHGAFSVLSPLGGVFWVPSVHRVGYDLLRSRRGLLGRLLMAVHPYHVVRLRLERTMLAPGGYSALLTQAEGVKADVVSVYGVPESDVEVLPLGFDDDVFNPGRRAEARAAARARFGYGEGDRVVLFVGNELERKGWDTLMSAVAKLDDPSVRVLGAGRIAPEAPPPFVHWAGADQDVAQLHAAADAFALPTRYEPWGLAIVEALGSGLPVVTTRLAGAAVAVDEGATGRLLPDPDDERALAEAIAWAMSEDHADPEAVSDSVRPYAWPGVVSRYTAILEREASDGG